MEFGIGTLDLYTVFNGERETLVYGIHGSLLVQKKFHANDSHVDNTFVDVDDHFVKTGLAGVCRDVAQETIIFDDIGHRPVLKLCKPDFCINTIAKAPCIFRSHFNKDSFSCIRTSIAVSTGINGIANFILHKIQIRRGIGKGRFKDVHDACLHLMDLDRLD